MTFQTLNYYLYFVKNILIIEGKKCCSVSEYGGRLNSSSIFSDRFKAVWNEIVNNTNKNSTIKEIKEYYMSFDEDNSDLYIVSQKNKFILNADLDIYGCTVLQTEDCNDKNSKVSSKIDKITIKLYSYKTSLDDLKNYVEKLKNNYLSKIEKSRSQKRFIYTLYKTKCDEDSNNSYQCWNEQTFESNRIFNNIFFEQKEDVKNKISFYLNNKNWYDEKGIPYTLGIGLSGPPGTGKTSFIKCLANWTNRNIVIISLKLIKTKRQLEEFFYEDRYNYNNKKNSIGFDKKIIVIEDIDCATDIVLNREEKNKKKVQKMTNDIKSSSTINEVLNKFVETSGDTKITNPILKIQDSEPVTLDDILNLWDGIKETPGRILIISSNHFEKLDPALVRPGRIDMLLKFDNCTNNVITEMYKHLYNKEVLEENEIDKISKVKSKIYSPAEIINMYKIYNNDSDKFLDRLCTNKKH